jgi:hypothetical protein
MDELLQSISTFKITNDKEQFEDDLDDVISKFNQQELHDSNYEWENLCLNYSKLKYLDEITKNYYIPESEKFLLALEKFMNTIDNMNKKYVSEIYWEGHKYELKEAHEIKRLLDLSLEEKDPIGKMHYCLDCYKLFVSVVEDFRNETYQEKIDTSFIEEFNFKRRKLN